MMFRGRRVLVTGATGFIGGRLLERLVVEEGATVRALVRDFSRAPRIARFPIEMIAGETYRACQRAVRLRKERNCLHCYFEGFCDTTPMHEHGSVDGAGRCVVHRRAIREIETVLRGTGVDRATIGEWAREALATASGTPIGV